jgi:deferrochelatase/peroxidase EfeB
MYELIMGPVAAAAVGKCAKVVNHVTAVTEIQCAMEVEFGAGEGNENLEPRPLPIGITGFIVGTANPKTVVRLLVPENEQDIKPGIYHVKFSNLELLTSDESLPTETSIP